MVSSRVLAVETEAQSLQTLQQLCDHCGVELHVAANAQEGLVLLEQQPYAVVVAAVNLPDISGLQLVGRIKRRLPHLPVVLLASQPRIAEAVRAIKLGATDYLNKPLTMESLEMSLTSLLVAERLDGEELARNPEPPPVYSKLQTTNVLMRKAVNAARRLADVRTPVLLEGEPGVGKALLAREMHAHSRRQRAPFVEVECSTLAEYLLASELFGHVRGAFSGAGHTRRGKLELGDGGVVFVNSIAEASLALQRRLLRVLEDGIIERLGEGRPIPVDVKIVAATTRDLEEMVWEGRFSEPLYQRLNVARVHLPPLRRRHEDVGLLARHFLTEFRQKNGTGPTELAPETVSVLGEYSWPGNVTELESVMETAASLCREEVLRPGHLPEVLTKSPPVLRRAVHGLPGRTSLSRSLEVREKELIEQALTATRYNIQRSARLLEISRPTLYAKIRQFGLERESE